MASIARKFFSPMAVDKPTVGDTKTSLVESDHLGWLKCDGRSLNVSEFYFLYQLIGNTYGGNSRTFNLPNPAGRVIGIIGTGPTLTSRAYGASVGAETHTLTIPEMPIHAHTGTTNTALTGVTDSGHAHSYTATNSSNDDRLIGTSDVNNGTNAATTGNSTANISDPGHVHTFTTNNTGGSLAHNNMQPTLFVGNLFIYCGKIEKTNFPLMLTKIY